MFTVSSCWLIGDSAFKVKGNIIATDENSKPYYLDLYLADSDDFIRSIEITKDFEESVTIAPWVRKYYMVIRSRDGKLKYKTKIFELGNMEHYENPIDLGSIFLKGNK